MLVIYWCVDHLNYVPFPDSLFLNPFHSLHILTCNHEPVQDIPEEHFGESVSPCYLCRKLIVWWLIVRSHGRPVALTAARPIAVRLTALIALAVGHPADLTAPWFFETVVRAIDPYLGWEACSHLVDLDEATFCCPGASSRAVTADT